MKSKFNPEIDILKFNAEDIITASLEEEPNNAGKDDGDVEGLVL